MFLFGFDVGAIVAEAIAAVTAAKLVFCSVTATAISSIAVFVFHVHVHF